MSVVGFDFGTLSCTVCVVRKRGVEVLQNNIGKRSTETLVAFGSDSRIIGAEAVAQAASNAKNTVSQVKRLLGRTMADKDLEEETKFLPYKLVKGQDNSVAVEVRMLHLCGCRCM